MPVAGVDTASARDSMKAGYAGGGPGGRRKKLQARRLAAALLAGRLTPPPGKEGLAASPRRQVLKLVLMSVGRTFLQNRQALVHGELFKSAFLRSKSRFARCLAENVAMCLALSWLEGQSGHALTVLNVALRQQLTGMLHARYFEGMVYYKLNHVDRLVDNPEQRVCEDVPKFSHGLTQVVGDCVPALVDSAFYSVRLYRTTRSHKSALAMLAYIVGAGAVISQTSPNFGKLFARRQDLEGAYRALHSRLRANAESVALYQGIAVEREGISASFEALRHQIEHVLRSAWGFGVVSDFVLKYLGATVSVGLIIGPFFNGHMRPRGGFQGRAEMLKNMRYHTTVVVSLFTALGVLGGTEQRLNKLGAFASRIYELQDACQQLGPAVAAGEGSSPPGLGEGTLEESEEIAFENVTVATPSDTKLIEGLTLKVRPGTNLLVTGPNGSGKSSLFRVLGGLWKLREGRVAKPGGAASGLASEIFYVPQRPYVSVGTLLEQIVYPNAAEEAPEAALTSEELEALLRQVDLEHLLAEHGVDRALNWGDVLSLGEQQRLGMARLFYHKPKFAILDECTSGVTTDMEQRFCDVVQEMGCTCITISHRPALVAFHDVALHLDGEGGWTLKSLNGDAGPVGAGGGARVGGDRAQQSTEVFEGMIGKSPLQRQASQEDLHLGKLLAQSPAALDEPPFPARGSPDAARQGPDDRAPAGALAHRPRRPSTATASGERRLLRLFVPRPRSKEALHVVLLALAVVVRTALSDRIANLNGQGVKHAINQDRRAFVRLIAVSALQSVTTAITAPTLKYLTDLLAIDWRTRITRCVAEKYLRGNAFYSVIHLDHMKDADQRVTRDVERLCDDMAALVPSMVKPIVDLSWFTWRCYRLTGLKGLGILYAYTLFGYGALKCVTPDLGRFAAAEFELEGAFRYSHARLGAAAESVAFFGGGPKEGKSIDARFNALSRHIVASSAQKLRYSIVDTFLTRHLPHSMTWVVSLIFALDYPNDFSTTEEQGRMVSDMRYLATVVTNNFVAFGEILGLHRRLSELKGGFQRVAALLETVEGHTGRAGPAEPPRRSRNAAPALAAHRGPAPCIRFERADVVTPTGALLARELTVDVRVGRNLLVTGPNGSGKTSLFRVLAGLWPLGAGAVSASAAGEGSLRAATFNVPQKTYTTVGTLREQIVYPDSLEMTLRGGRFGSLAELDADLDELMRAVRLSYLVERWGWGAQTEWGERLSLGEQQRIGMARLFFRRPVFAVLDECTNATSVDIEEGLYREAQRRGVTLVTVTQRPALVKFHAQELRLVDGSGGGRWSLHHIQTPPRRQTREAAPRLFHDSDDSD